MKEGWYNRSFEATLQNGIAVNIRRFPSIVLDE
jgi:maltose phosphorylase